MFSILFLCMTQAQALEPDVVEHLKRGTVFVRVEGGGEASGFFVSENLVVTNRHVVEAVGVGGTLEIVVDSGTADGAHLQGTVAHLAAERDLALVEVPGGMERVLEFGSQRLPHETESVVAVGFPMGSVRSLGDLQTDPPASLRPGAVTALHWARNGQALYIEHNANMQTGSSGGALVDDQGLVIGVNVAMLRQDQTTKLAIPAQTVVEYLLHWRDHPSLGVGASRPQAAVGERLRDQLAKPFREGRILDLGLTPDGRAYVMDNKGGVFRVTENGWEDIGAGTNNADLAVDDLTGDLFVVESDQGRVLRRGAEGRWKVVSEGPFTHIAASAGVLWALNEEGEVHTGTEQGWRRLDIPRMDDLWACGGLALPIAGGQVWGLDKEGEVANNGRALVSGLKSISCYRDRVYALQLDGSVVDVLRGELVPEAGVRNRAVHALPTGLLAWSEEGRLSWVSSDETGSSRVQKTENQ